MTLPVVFMNASRPLSRFFGLFALLNCCCAVAASPPRLLVDTADQANVPKYVSNDCRMRVVQTRSGPALGLIFGNEAPWPNVRFLPDRLGYPRDWSGYTLLALTVSNPTDIPVKVNLRVDSENANSRCRQGGIALMPGRKVRMLLAIGERKAIAGMRGQPPLRYERQENDVEIAHNNSALDWQRVTRFEVFTVRPERDHAILVHRIELIRADDQGDRTKFVDRFGQYKHAEWPGKLHDESEFAARLRAEQAYFAANPPLPDRDPYGGWKDGPQLEATGRFRAEKHRGKWWLVDPTGRLFWSSGITCVRFNTETAVAERRRRYEWLPADGDPLARFYTGNRRMFDFFEANAYRKYGNDYVVKFYDVTMKRLQAWGINTLGNWSEPEIWRLRRMPYTMPIHVPNVPKFVATSHKWFPDPFAAEFRETLEEQLAAKSEIKDDPWLLGVFIHNELPWTLGTPWRSNSTPTGIGVLCLQKNDDSSSAKRNLVDWLRTKHGAIANLNRAWGTTFADWQSLAGRFELTDAQRKRALADLTELDKLIARQYFRVCREAMDKRLPGVLYLGCRFSGMYDRHVVEVAKEYCDVVSFNIYEETPSGRTADELAVELDFPVVIGEFHFGSLDRGMFHPGLQRAKDQADRAEKYAAYIREAAVAPWCVGAHWFQYLDQPLTGRLDGENYSVGFVDATDDPYPELRAAARKVHSKLYHIRY
jgi:hypothetical protein